MEIIVLYRGVLDLVDLLLYNKFTVKRLILPKQGFTQLN